MLVVNCMSSLVVSFVFTRLIPWFCDKSMELLMHWKCMFQWQYGWSLLHVLSGWCTGYLCIEIRISGLCGTCGAAVTSSYLHSIIVVYWGIGLHMLLRCLRCASVVRIRDTGFFSVYCEWSIVWNTIHLHYLLQQQLSNINNITPYSDVQFLPHLCVDCRLLPFAQGSRYLPCTIHLLEVRMCMLFVCAVNDATVQCSIIPGAWSDNSHLCDVLVTSPPVL